MINPRWSVVIAVAVFVILAAAPGIQAATVVLPDQSKVENVDFERHVMGIFGRMGCNSGSCHGSFQGRGGLRLSLFGYDPAMDFANLTREGLGRRINPVDPDSSLLLMKATGQTSHDGGRRFSKDSWAYQLIREWIAGGAIWKDGSGALVRMWAETPEHLFGKVGETKQLVIRAQFSDGSETTITPLCDFRTMNDAVAEVSNLGVVTALRPGDTAIIVSYRGNVLSLRVMVPNPVPAGFRYPQVPEVNFVDQHVFAKLRRLNIVPSDLSADAEFLRRAYLDTIGCLPSPDEVRAFLADRDPNKRTKKIDELLAHPMHGALWATKFCDITGNNTDLLENPVQLKTKRSQMWYDWLRRRFAENMPYDEIVKGILTATSREGNKSPEDWIGEVRKVEENLEKGFDDTYSQRATLDLFWRRQVNVPIEQWGEKTAAAFLGVRLECAQCHKHPTDRWTQVDYRSYANVFSSLNFGASPEAKKVIDEFNKGAKAAKNKAPIAKEIFIGAPKGLMVHPTTNATLPAKAPGGPEIKLEAGKDPRVELWHWLRSPDNPLFARSFVNRVWAHYFGIGLVNPVDDFSQANPPSNPALLDALAKEFIDSKFNIRHIERIVMMSRTYQLSSVPNATNELDRDLFSHAFVRPLMAEVVVDTINSALGTTENFGADAPPGSRAIEIGASRVQNQVVAQAFRVFGRPSRTSACDCDRAMEPALAQTLFRMTEPTILQKISSPTGRLQQLLKSPKSDEQILEELFLATLTRFPTAQEKERFLEHRRRVTDRQAAFTDTLWALINTREFILNH